MTGTHKNLSLRRRGQWTEETRDLACEMAEAKATRPEIALATGMSESAVTALLGGIWRPTRRKIKGKKKGGGRSSARLYASVPKSLPPEMEDDRAHRLAAADRRDFTSAFFGDPPPGYSALDQKRRAEV